MKRKIFNSIFFVALAVLISCLLLSLQVLYEYFTLQYQNQLKEVAGYVAQGVAHDGIEYFENLSQSEANRITWIDDTGNVLYDSKVDASNLPNHSDREEIWEALEHGIGESSRFSSTLSEKTYYYAVRISNGTVVRVSGTYDSIFAIFLGMIWSISLIVLAAVLLSALLAAKVSKAIVSPINQIDLDNPTKNWVYDELSPLLSKISAQNTLIEKQMKQLKRKQEEFETITENMSEGFIVVDRNTDILSFNSSALKLLGASAGSPKQSVYTLNRSEGFIRAVELALEGKNNQQPLRIGDKHYQLIANPVRQDNKPVGAIIVILDMTEREEFERMRREFTANVSHELKTPLTSISGFAEIIKNGLVKEPEKVEQFAQNIYTEAQRLITLVEDIIKLSRLDEDQIQLKKEAVDLFEIAQAVTQQLKAQADKQNITINLTGESAKVLGIRQILEEMVYNLCDNAIKYNKSNGKVDISVYNSGGRPTITVADTGIGIPPSEQKRVFERFYRVDKSHSKEIGGTGLGLSIVKHAAAYHNANLTLDSQPNIGTRLTIEFSDSVT